MPPDFEPGHLINRILEPGEIIDAVVAATDAHLILTDKRLVVASPWHVALDVAMPELRRIQFDIERNRPATMVVVPEWPHHEPQVLAIPPDQYEAAGQILGRIGKRLHDSKAAGRPKRAQAAIPPDLSEEAAS